MEYLEFLVFVLDYAVKLAVFGVYYVFGREF